MEKIINRLINDEVAGVDIYTNAGSTWLIFTETKEWVIELTKKGALWYNYNFFKNLFAYLGFDVVENQHYITKWVENTLQNVVKHTWTTDTLYTLSVEDTIQNGVKHTNAASFSYSFLVEDTIQNGVKHTSSTVRNFRIVVEDTIQNGVKKTLGVEDGTFTSIGFEGLVENTLKNGVKHTEPGGYLGSIEMKGEIVHQLESPKQNGEVEDVIQNGVIETFPETHRRRQKVVQTVRDGIKQTCAQIPSIDAVVERVVEEGIKETHDDVYHHTARVEGVIRNGIKEVQPLPAQDGNMDWGNYYHRQEDRTKPHTQYVKDVIENGDKLN